MPESGGCTWINKCRTSTWHKVDKRSHCGKKKAGLSMKLCWMWRRKAGVGGDGEEETTLCVMWGGRWRRCWSEHPRRVVRTGVSTALGPALFQQRLRVCTKPRLYFLTHLLLLLLNQQKGFTKIISFYINAVKENFKWWGIYIFYVVQTRLTLRFLEEIMHILKLELCILFEIIILWQGKITVFKK